jgi:hypothetical protein
MARQAGKARKGTPPADRVARPSILIPGATALLATTALALIVLVLGRGPADVPGNGGEPQLA